MDSKQERPGRSEGEDQHGWSPDVGTGPSSEEAVAGSDKAFDASNAGEPGPGRQVSDAEREGVSGTDTEAQTPLGVGESTTRRAEDIAKSEDSEGVEHLGTKGKSQRPYGTRTAESSTGVDPQDPVHPDSPNMPPA